MRTFGRILLALVAGLTATSLAAAEIREVSQTASGPGSLALRPGPLGLAEAAKLDPEITLVPIGKPAIIGQVRLTRYQVHYRGIAVWAQQLVAEQTGSRLTAILGTAPFGVVEAGPRAPKLTSKDALNRVVDSILGLGTSRAVVQNPSSDLRYVVAPDGRMVLSYVVSFFAEGPGQPATRPVVFVDAESGQLMWRYENLQTAGGTGPGGNLKTGRYVFGTAPWPTFEVAQAGSTCSMVTANVLTKDMNSSTTEPGGAFAFPCFNNTVRQINGAYSPLNDAHAFGGFLFRTYTDWYGVRPLTQRLVVRVHYGSNYQNAFWNGTSMSFGDGANTFYPLTSVDVMGHEVSHGFTEQHSGLIYSNQSGGINEAYSDMGGEATEAWLFANHGAVLPRALPDYLVGADIMKSGTSLRDMCTPRAPSIDHVSKYYDGLDVHYSSGVFNKAFCLLAKSPGWGPRKAFEVFLLANSGYWTPSSTFQLAAQGVQRAAQDKGYDTSAIVTAFGSVGITLGGTPPPQGGYTMNTLRVIDSTSPRGCGYGDWNCMTTICRADLSAGASRNWAGCWRNGGTWQCYFECSTKKQLS